MAPRKKGRTVGIGSVNKVARADENFVILFETGPGDFSDASSNGFLTCRLDSQEDLLDMMAVGYPTLQRALEARRATLGMQHRNPESTDRESPEPSVTANYFENVLP